MTISKKQVRKQLDEVLDPELNLSITDLGLVYQIEVKKANRVVITMTLTTIGCPLFSTIEEEIKDRVSEIGIKKEDIQIKLTFEPPWSMEMMSENAKAMLGI